VNLGSTPGVASIQLNQLFNVKGFDFVDLRDAWNEKKVFSITFANKEPSYMRIFFDKLISQAYNFSAMQKAAGKRIKMLFLIDDCQLMFDQQSNDSNCANRAIENVLWMGGGAGFNTIFGAQDVNKLSTTVWNGATDKFIGFVDGLAGIELEPEIKQLIKDNRRRFREYPLSNGLTKKTVCYTHLPRFGDPRIFFPNDPNCGGYG